MSTRPNLQLGWASGGGSSKPGLTTRNTKCLAGGHVVRHRMAGRGPPRRMPSPTGLHPSPRLTSIADVAAVAGETVCGPAGVGHAGALAREEAANNEAILHAAKKRVTLNGDGLIANRCASIHAEHILGLGGARDAQERQPDQQGSGVLGPHDQCVLIQSGLCQCVHGAWMDLQSRHTLSCAAEGGFYTPSTWPPSPAGSPCSHTV